MKHAYALSLVGALAVTAALPVLADDKRTGPDVADKPAKVERPATPHFKPTGKPPSVARGEQVYNDHCALCHGLHGKGDGPRSAFFQPNVQFIPDLTLAAYLQGRDAQLLENIRQGLRRLPEPAYIMPQFKYILSEEEIKSALMYIKTLPAQARALPDRPKRN